MPADRSIHVFHALLLSIFQSLLHRCVSKSKMIHCIKEIYAGSMYLLACRGLFVGILIGGLHAMIIHIFGPFLPPEKKQQQSHTLFSKVDEITVCKLYVI